MKAENEKIKNSLMSATKNEKNFKNKIDEMSVKLSSLTEQLETKKKIEENNKNEKILLKEQIEKNKKE